MEDPKELYIYGGKTYADVLREGLTYIDQRRKGLIKSFRTPWAGVNAAGLNGIEWGNMFTLAARPGAGKTLIASQIIREAKIHNPDQDFNILEFQFEMGDKQYAARQYSAETALDYNKVLSAEKALDDFSFSLMQQYLYDTEQLEKAGVKRILIKNPLTHSEMAHAIVHYYKAMGSKPMVITIDHSWLIKKAGDEREKIQTLYNTAETLMQIKNKLPVAIIMLTQVNRTVEDVSRIVPGMIQNYPTSADIFGGDALMQASDIVGMLNRPSKYSLNVYGPNKYMVSPNDIFLHYVKTRNGGSEDNVLFMRAEFDKQRLVEGTEPPRDTSAASGGYIPYSMRTGGGSGRQVQAPIGQEL